MLAAVFVFSLATIAFTYAGYPCLMMLWAHFANAVEPDAAYEPHVVVLVVGHNEADRIAAKIASCLAQSYPAEKLRVLVVSDGSNDAMVDVVRELDEDRVRMLAFGKRRGKAACLNDAIETCDEEVIVLTDARQPLHCDAVRYLVADLADEAIGAVGGELVLLTAQADGFGEGIDAYWRYEKFIRRQESRAGSTVGVSGALYALRRSLWRPIPPNTILDDVLIPMNVVMQGKRVIFESRALAWDQPSATPRRERMRKVRTLAGNFQLLALRPELLLPWRNPIFFQFVAHKCLRLLVPVFMALALACNGLLAHENMVWTLLLAAQLACYLIAVAGALVPALCRWLPVKLLTTFLLLNAFVVLGFIKYLFDGNAHIWHLRARPADLE